MGRRRDEQHQRTTARALANSKTNPQNSLLPGVGTVGVHSAEQVRRRLNRGRRQAGGLPVLTSHLAGLGVGAGEGQVLPFHTRGWRRAQVARRDRVDDPTVATVCVGERRRGRGWGGLTKVVKIFVHVYSVRRLSCWGEIAKTLIGWSRYCAVPLPYSFVIKTKKRHLLANRVLHESEISTTMFMHMHPNTAPFPPKINY